MRLGVAAFSYRWAGTVTNETGGGQLLVDVDASLVTAGKTEKHESPRETKRRSFDVWAF